MILTHDIIAFHGEDAREQEDAIVHIAAQVFSGFDGDYVRSRLPHVVDPLLIVAAVNKQWLGFKLGYRRGPSLYSWIGGVHPDGRRRGIAQGLMNYQHEAARTLGYQSVTTRTRAVNNPMIILNLRNGFHISGFEVDEKGMAVVTQQKIL